MQRTLATVTASGQLHLTEEQTCALGVPQGGEIEIWFCDAHLELRKKRPSSTFLDAGTLLGNPESTEDAQSRARREDEDFARRTSGC